MEEDNLRKPKQICWMAKNNNFGGNLIWQMTKNDNFGGDLILRMTKNVNFGGKSAKICYDKVYFLIIFACELRVFYLHPLRNP